MDSSGNNIIFSIEVNKKKFGAQFGGIISIEKKEKEKERKFFKTHQNESRFTNYSGTIYNSKSLSLAGPVNIRELFNWSRSQFCCESLCNPRFVYNNYRFE